MEGNTLPIKYVVIDSRAQTEKLLPYIGVRKCCLESLSMAALAGRITARRAAKRLSCKQAPQPLQNAYVQKRVIFYDLETSIVAKRKASDPVFPKGMTRRNLIVEIGAVDSPATGGSSTFHRLVDPRIENLSLVETLALTNQNARGTFTFWNKLFYEKKIITKEEKRERRNMPVEEQAILYDTLFDADVFVPAKKALSEFIAFCILGRSVSNTPILVAHNGKSFDHNILRHHCHKLHLPQLSCEMYDSIPVARQIIPGLRSYSLGALHDRLVGIGFQQHHALADAHALNRICKALAEREGLSDVSCLWSKSHGSLTSIKGVGAKTSKTIRNAGYSLLTLHEAVLERETCPSPLRKSLRNHKSLWKTLRKKWIKEEKKQASKKRNTRRERSKSI